MCREERIGCPLQTTHPDASLTHRACSLETQWLATLPRFRLRRTGMSDYFAPGREPQPLPHHLGLPHTWEAFRSMGHAPLLYDAWPGGLGLGQCDGFTLLLGPGVTLLRCCSSVADQRLPCATACSKALLVELHVVFEHVWTKLGICSDGDLGFLGSKKCCVLPLGQIISGRLEDRDDFNWFGSWSALLLHHIKCINNTYVSIHICIYIYVELYRQIVRERERVL